MEPTNSDPPDLRNRWRSFVLIEFLLLFVAPFLFLASLHYRWMGWVLSAVGTWLCFTLPIAFLYLIGKPPVMSLSPLIPSREARAYGRELWSRAEIDEDAFFESSYSHTSIPRDIPIRIRRLCMEHLDPLYSRVQPADRFWLLVEDIDLADFVRILEREFGITLDRERCATIDTFDSLVQFVASTSHHAQETHL
jgi:acyl carrier protein